MRWRGQRQSEWLTILGWTLAVGMGIVAIPVSDYVTRYKSAAAPYLVILAVIIMLGTIAAGFVGRIPGWIMAIPVGFCVGFILMTSETEGWQNWVQNALYGLSAFVVIVLIVWVLRLYRRLSAVDRALTSDEEIDTDYFFRDDGQRIVVHADKRKLAGLIILLAIFVAMFTLMLFIPKMPWFMLVLLIAGMGLIALTTLLCVVRFALPGPTLDIGPEGLRDNSSVFAFGRGLLRWDEVFEVFVFETKSRSIIHRYFAVLLADGKAVQRRMPAWQRLLALPFSLMGPDMFVITRSLLDRPPDVLVAEIKRYVAEHAPKGWDSPLIADVDETESEPNQAE